MPLLLYQSVYFCSFRLAVHDVKKVQVFLAITAAIFEEQLLFAVMVTLSFGGCFVVGVDHLMK